MGLTKERNKRSAPKMQTKPYWLVVCEGKNKTEATYLEHFNSRFASIRLDVKPSESTDPISIAEKAAQLAEKQKLDLDDCDRVYCLIDTDLNDTQLQKIDKMRRKYPKFKFILSNPCFEVWFLYHFVASPHKYGSSKNAKRGLSKYIPDYKENMDVFEKVPEIKTNIKLAIERVRARKNLLEKDGLDIYGADGNPYTDVYELMQNILNAAIDQFV